MTFIFIFIDRLQLIMNTNSTDTEIEFVQYFAKIPTFCRKIVENYFFSLYLCANYLL
jgi:hypothetical protein